MLYLVYTDTTWSYYYKGKSKWAIITSNKEDAPYLVALWFQSVYEFPAEMAYGANYIALKCVSIARIKRVAQSVKYLIKDKSRKA